MKFEMTEPLSQQQLDDFKERDAAWFTGKSSAWKLGNPLIKLGFGVLGRKLLLQRRADEGAGPIWVYKRVKHVEFVCLRECRAPLTLFIHVARRWPDSEFHVELQNGLGQQVFSERFDEKQKVCDVRTAATTALVEKRLLSTGQKLVLHWPDNVAVRPATPLTTLTKRRRQ